MFRRHTPEHVQKATPKNDNRSKILLIKPFKTGRHAAVGSPADPAVRPRGDKGMRSLFRINYHPRLKSPILWRTPSWIRTFKF
jgi:hypothetical protein